MSNLAYKDDAILTKPLKYTCRVGEGAAKLSKLKTSEIDDSKIKIVHTMADGTIRDSIEGYEMPYNDVTAVAYELLTKWTMAKNGI